MNILIDTNVLIKIAIRYTYKLRTYYEQLEKGGNIVKPDVLLIIKRLIGNNNFQNLYSSNIERKEFSEVSLRKIKEGVILEESAKDVGEFLLSIPNKFEYTPSDKRDLYVTKVDLEQQNDQRIYISASDVGVTHILTYDNHFPPFPKGFAHICENPAKIIRPNKNFRGFHNFFPKKKNEHYSNSIAGRLLEKFDKLLHMFS